MTTTYKTPVVEQVSPEQASMRLYVRMTLASVKVSVSGTYNVHSNTFYPYDVAEIEGNELGDRQDLEEYCEFMGWDFDSTHNAIQEAVENR